MALEVDGLEILLDMSLRDDLAPCSRDSMDSDDVFYTPDSSPRPSSPARRLSGDTGDRLLPTHR